MRDDQQGDQYPPEPWRLRGEAVASLWWVREPVFPQPLPQGVRPLEILGRNLVGAMFVRYSPPGDLEYNELASVVGVRHPRGIGLTITHIWVDSVASMVGARELWGVPKQLAVFGPIDGVPNPAKAKDLYGGTIATESFRPGLPIPGRWPFQALVAQTRQGELALTRLQAKGRVRLGRAQWHFAPAGPLAHLPAECPFLSLILQDGEIVFGG